MALFKSARGSDSLIVSAGWRALLAVIAVLSLAAGATEAQDNAGAKTMLDILGSDDSANSTENEKACDRAFYSSACDRWVHAYIKNDFATAQAAWTELLTEMKNCRSIDPYVDQLYDRIRFASPILQKSCSLH
jgi:hypothetical protein